MKKFAFVLARLPSLEEYISMALKYARFDGIYKLLRCARREYFSRSVDHIERKSRGKIGISEDAVMFFFQNPTYPTEYRQIHAWIRETGEPLNISNAKEQLVEGYERGKNRGKRYVGRFRIEIKIGFCERTRHFTFTQLSRADAPSQREIARKSMKVYFILHRFSRISILYEVVSYKIIKWWL